MWTEAWTGWYWCLVSCFLGFHVNKKHTTRYIAWFFVAFSLCLCLQVYWVWRSSSSSTRWRLGIFSCKVYSERGIIHQLLHGKFIICWFQYVGSPFWNIRLSPFFLFISVSWWNKFWSNCWWSLYCYKLWLWCTSWWIR
jgi:hypothetical protein